MKSPSVTRMANGLDISYGLAKVLNLLMSEEIEPELFVKDASGDAPEKIMKAVDVILQNHGVEVLRKKKLKIPYYGDIRFMYSNTGDTYATTLMFDALNGRFIMSDIGSLVEKGYAD